MIRYCQISNDKIVSDFVVYGVQVGTSFGGPQPIMYNPQAAQMPSQPYFHQNGPQVGSTFITLW